MAVRSRCSLGGGGGALADAGWAAADARWAPGAPYEGRRPDHLNQRLMIGGAACSRPVFKISLFWL